MIKVGVKIFWSCTKYNINNFKDILKFLFGPKYLRKYFCISALASKKRSNQKNKGALYNKYTTNWRTFHFDSLTLLFIG